MWVPILRFQMLCVVSLASLALVSTSVRAADPVLEARKKLLPIQIRLETAQTQFKLAVNYIKEYERQEKLDEIRAAANPDYTPVATVTRLSGKLSMISRKYTALSRISTLVQQKLKVARALPLSEQMKIVNEELTKARQRQRLSPSAAATSQVISLISAKSRLELEMARRRP